MEDHSLFQEVTCNLCGLDKRIAELQRDLAAAQQGESVEQGMRKECEEYITVLKADLAAARAEIDRLTAVNQMHRDAALQIAKDAEAEVERAQASLAERKREVESAVYQMNEAKTERANMEVNLAAANTRADAMFRTAEKWEAEAAALRVDAERGKWMIDHAEWWRDGDETRMVIRVADKADLSCYAMRELAIDQARGAHD